MLPKGILFDLDDTIIAYTQVAEPTWRSVCLEYADTCKLFNGSSLSSAIMNASNWYWSDAERHRIGRGDLNKARRYIVEIAFKRLNLLNNKLAWEIADSFSVRREEEVYLFDGALETLDYLKENGVSLTMITNGESEKQRNKIQKFDLAKYFKSILIEGELGFGKPDEAIYTKALNELELRPDEVWAVGDNLEWDVSGPQKLGIFGIWNDYAKKGLPHDSNFTPDMIIHSIAELMK